MSRSCDQEPESDQDSTQQKKSHRTHIRGNWKKRAQATCTISNLQSKEIGKKRVLGEESELNSKPCVLKKCKRRQEEISSYGSKQKKAEEYEVETNSIISAEAGSQPCWNL